MNFQTFDKYLWLRLFVLMQYVFFLNCVLETILTKSSLQPVISSLLKIWEGTGLGTKNDWQGSMIFLTNRKENNKMYSILILFHAKKSVWISLITKSWSVFSLKLAVLKELYATRYTQLKIHEVRKPQTLCIKGKRQIRQVGIKVYI